MENQLSYLFLLNSLSIGGSERKTVKIANELCGRGYAVHVAYLSESQAIRSELHQKIACVCLHRKGPFSLKALWLLRQYIRKFDLCNIFCINLYPMIYGLLATTAVGKPKRRCLVFVNITEFHSVHTALQMILYQPMLRCVSRVIFGCKYQKNLWLRRYWLNSASCSYIYNGVDTTWFSPQKPLPDWAHIRELYGFTTNDVVIGMVGQLRPEKNYPELLAACRLLVDAGLPVRVLIVGDGPERAKLHGIVQANRLERHVVFLGQVNDVRPALLAMDIFVLTSSSVETFSNAALEAMAMEKPVVLSTVGGAMEMVFEGVNGYLYQSGNVTELVAILHRLIVDDETRQNMGRMARSVVAERFTLARMVDAYEDLAT